MSSFLLTSRLCSELHRANSLIQKTSVICQYFIKRIFRIYIPFIIYFAAVTYGPNFVGYKPKMRYVSWEDITLYLNSGCNSHLWSIGPELRYYFCIPIICIVANICGQYCLIYLITLFGIALNNEKF